VSTFVTGRCRTGLNSKTGFYPAVLYVFIAFLTARSKPGSLSAVLTTAALIHAPADKQWLQATIIIKLFTSGTVIAFILTEHRRRTEIYFGGGCTCIGKEQELIAQQQ
jgi:general stress protein CsbA